MAERVCSECGNSLAGKAVTAKTCCERCRQTRTRRLHRAKREEEEYTYTHPHADLAVREEVRREAPAHIARVIRDELQPIVREALTEDVLRAVSDMLDLAPRAVELMKDDLEDPDPVVRQRAYSMIVKYTIGHPALLKPMDTEPSGQLVVNFNLPRPDDTELTVTTGEVVDEEMHTCDMCSVEKPVSEFVAGSTRCAQCYETWKATIQEQFA